VRFTIEGEPVPKGRPRLNTRTGTFYTPPTTKTFEGAVAYNAMSQRERILDGNVEVVVTFYTAKKKPSDLDNLIKSVLDGLNRHAFADDSQVTEIKAKRIRSENPRTEVEVRYAEESTE